MAVLHSTLLPRGLFLCLGMLFISAISANYTNNSANYGPATYIKSSTVTAKIKPDTPPKIQVHPDVYESNTVYTVWIPVTTDITHLVLRALDINDNAIGFWRKANWYSAQSVLYNVTKPYNKIFTAKWESANSTNITTVEIQAFSFHLETLHAFSRVKINKRAMTTMSPYKTMMSPYKTARSPYKTTMSPYKTTMSPYDATMSPYDATMSPYNTTMSPYNTTMSPYNTTMSPYNTTMSPYNTSRSLGNRIFLSPIEDAIQITLVFLITKLLLF